MTTRAIPLKGDASAIFLPWIVGAMAYLATLALIAAILADAGLARWSQDLGDRLTVEVAVTEGAERHLPALLEMIDGAAGTGAIEVLSRSAAIKLIEPWLGPGLASDLPLPALIDVEVTEREALDLAALEHRLSTLPLTVHIEDHGRWLGQLTDIGRAVRLGAIVILAIIAAVAVCAIVFAMETGLAAHRDVVDLLHVIGARDSFIARQFGRHAFRIGLVGGAIGTIAGIFSWAALLIALEEVEPVLLPQLVPKTAHWAWALAVPAATAALAVISARIAVLRRLSRLDE